MAVFSVTERGVFRRCRRKAVLSSRNGRHLTRLLEPLATSVGSLVHRAQQLWVTDPSKPLTQHGLQAAVEAEDRVIATYTRQVGCRPSQDELLTLHESIDVALLMLVNYEKKYGAPLPPEYKLLRAEQTIRVPVKNTEHPCERCEVEGLPKGSILVRTGPGTSELIVCPDCDGSGTAQHYLEGKVDGLLQHVTGRIDVLERKTYGARPSFPLLYSNDQFLAYLWLVKQLGFNPHLDSCIAYDGMWRRALVPKGKTFNDLFLRVTLTRTPAELEEFEKYLPIELNEMALLYSKPEQAYINRDWRGCFDCQFFDKNGQVDLCLAMSRGERDLVKLLLDTRYTERTDDLETEETE